MGLLFGNNFSILCSADDFNIVVSLGGYHWKKQTGDIVGCGTVTFTTFHGTEIATN
jgi:hypothetical protein